MTSLRLYTIGKLFKERRTQQTKLKGSREALKFLKWHVNINLNKNKIKVMGLDMYLYKKTFLHTGEWVREDKRCEVIITEGGKPHPFINPKKIDYIVEEVGYWRKANQIHQWFVKNVQKDQDDCREYRVDYEQLRDLLNVCEDVLDDHGKAEQLLPRSSGFFFGSTDYDDYYFEQVQNTYDILMSIVSAGDADTQEYTYQSSW
jgi:hypothetical protein